jgi:hypothetical protein
MTGLVVQWNSKNLQCAYCKRNGLHVTLVV